MLRTCVFACVLALAWAGAAAPLYTLPPDVETRWASFENPTGAKGAGGTANQGAKGAAFAPVAAGETVTLMQWEGAGTVRRMWMTLSDRSPEMLRALRLRMYWDGAETPAVDVPLGDFAGAIHGLMVPFAGALFSNPEGRSINMSIPMPFRSAARVTLTNESGRRLNQLYYDINFTVNDRHPSNALYFHAHWHRVRWTALAEDFALLPRLEGGGRFLGVHVGILGHPDNIGWWGEGEVKVYLDRDTDLPTLVGTGTEDYVGTAYGQGEFSTRYQGSLIVDNDAGIYSFYRYHVPDPVYFRKDIRVTLQQMGGAPTADVLELIARGGEVLPVSTWSADTGFTPLMEKPQPVDLAVGPQGWTNMYRRDDVCATAFFYLDRPENGLPGLAPVAARVQALPAAR